MNAVLAPPPADAPLGTFPRRLSGRAPDGRRWDLLISARGVTAVIGADTVAEAHVWQSTGRVSIELWADGADLPDSLSSHLVEQAFAHPSVHPGHTVVVCLPRRHGGLLPHVLRHVQDPSTRAAGMTSLVEGRVHEAVALTLPAPRGT